MRNYTAGPVARYVGAGLLAGVIGVVSSCAAVERKFSIECENFVQEIVDIADRERKRNKNTLDRLRRRCNDGTATYMEIATWWMLEGYHNLRGEEK